MSTQEFTPTRLLGRGGFSLVYSVISQRQQDKNQVYALKRFILWRPIALLCALKEYKILKRLALLDNVSPFLPKLLQCFLIHESPVFLLKKESAFTLRSLMYAFNHLDENQARFYLSEIICGLRFLHALEIIHLELKPDNILLSETGHVIISDFDRSYAFTEDGPPKVSDFFTTTHFMAPEVARKQVISDKADVWTLGIIGSRLVGDIFRPQFADKELRLRLAKKGQWRLRCFSRITKEFKEFLQACFTIPYVLRPNIGGIQNLAFFKEVNWNVVQALQTVPPFLPHEIHASLTQPPLKYNPCDPLILNCLYEDGYPVVMFDAFRFRVDENGNRSLVKGVVNMDEFSTIGYTRQKTIETLNSFNFVHPCLESHQHSGENVQIAKKEGHS
ncbi:hypothetical protein Aperf_G00000048075 [Anoplocephala perfoliata]